LLSGCNQADLWSVTARLSYDRAMSEEPGTRLRFLSDEWRAAVREMSAEQLTGSVVDQPGLVVNATVTGVPFGERTLLLHSDRGPVIGWEPGHSPEAAFEIHVDYHVAKALVLDATATADALVQGFATQAVEVTGDASQYRHWWQARLGHRESVELEDRIRAITI
jgi:hypothetical protein